MDGLDKKIAEIIQSYGRASNAEVAAAVGVSVSTANERVRKMAAEGHVRGWHAELEPVVFGAGLCCFVLLDMTYEGEAEACEALVARREVMELHHISGAHSYLMKLRVRDTAQLQAFLSRVVKPIPAIFRTESVISLEALKESASKQILHED